MNESRPQGNEPMEHWADTEPAHNPHEHEHSGERQQPPRVDFFEIATHALEAGVFAPNPEMVQRNAEAKSDPTAKSTFPFPETMLEAPYGNGPSRIRVGEEDVPQGVMDQVRKNLVTANRLLLPYQQVLLYFHERFSAQDTFQSQGIHMALEEYNPNVREWKDPRPSELSFQTEGVDRTNKERNLFTEEELIASIELGRTDPAVALAILGYQGIVQDYLQNLGGAFGELAQHPGHQITQHDLENYQQFARDWNTSNFTNELMPAIAVYLTNARRANPEATTESLLTQELFQNAVDFIIGNGAFRNFVTVPAHVALDGNERVNNFLCPAVGAIRQQLLDGSLLHRIYSITSAKLQAGDPAALSLADAVSARAEKKLSERETSWARTQQRIEGAAKPTVEVLTEDKDLAEIAGEAIGQALDQGKPAVFTFEGKSYLLAPNVIEGGLSFHEEKQRDDQELIPGGGSSLYRVLEEAVKRAIQTDRPVFFLFNDTPWRVDPERVKALLQQPADGQQ